MIIKYGKRCSIHYHKKKTETFFVESGILRVLLFPSIVINSFEYLKDKIEPGKLEKQLHKFAEEHILKLEDKLRIEPWTLHQFHGAIEGETIFFEFSTQHFEDDSYRIVKGD